MISPRQEQALLDAAALGIDDDLRAAYRRLIDLIGEGMPPRDAVAAVMETFTGQYAQTLADGFSAILERSVGSAGVLAMKVGEVSLSSRLYAEARDVSAAVQTIVTRHAAGWQDARALTLELYEGYGFRADEPLKLHPRNPRLPKYLRSELLTDPGLAGELSRHFTEVHVSKLKTPALRAAYLEYLDEIKAGRGQAVLEKRIDVAFHEQMRYRANRIAQTELHRAYAERQAVEIMEDEDVGFVQIRMSQTHPKTDICDYYASVDRYGLGKGVYPKALAPRPGFHPFCRCIAVPRTNIKPGTKWRERPEAAQSWLRQQGLNEGAAVMGSRARRDQVLKGADPTEVWNSRIAAQQYRVGPLGEVPREGWVAQRLGSYPDAAPRPAGAGAGATLQRVKSAYETAKEGGAHAPWMKEQRRLGVRQLESAERSIRKQIEMHEAWISDPSSKIADWNDRDPRYQSGLLKKWQQDIKRQVEQVQIIRGVLQEKRNG
jgi:hypothetical protein